MVFGGIDVAKHGHDICVPVINPIQSNALRNLHVRKNKTHPKDTVLLADLLRLGRASETKFASRRCSDFDA